MAAYNLRDNFTRYTLEESADVLDAIPPTDDFLDELFGTMKCARDVRVIIVGQDDKPRSTAMAFSYQRGVTASDTVLSIIRAANKGLDDEDTLEIMPDDGYLGSWRDQGVLLIGCRTEVNKRLLAGICRNAKPVGILLGRESIEAAGSLFKVAYSWSHPSKRSAVNNDPKNPENWANTDVFWKANNALMQSGRGLINWSTVLHKGRIYLFVDGGYSMKRSSGKAGVVAYSSVGSYLGERVCIDTYPGTKISTNNVAELLAFRMGIDVIASTKYGKYTIYSDSKYTIDSVTQWYHEWVRDGKLKEKKNVPLIATIVAEFDARTEDIKVCHTRGHQKKPGNDASPLEKLVHRGNEHVDKLVSMA